MQYSNLKNEELPEEKVENVGEANVNVRKGVKIPEDLLVKKEACWFIAMVLTFILIGSVVFYVTHNGETSTPSLYPYRASTLPPIITTKPARSQVLLHADSQFKYFKVSVSNGTTLTEGKVADTCESVGMKAVCSGPSSCKYSSSRCSVTPLSTNCNNPMYPLSKLLCSGSKPRNCEQFEGVFSYMSNWHGGECGRVGYEWCANGDDFVAGTLEASPGMVQAKVEVYYAYCARAL